MKQKTTITLPERVVNGSLSAMARMEYKQLYDKFITAYRTMPFRLGEEVVPFDPKEMSYEKVKLYIEEITKNLTDSQKEPWEKMRLQAKNGMKHITAFLANYPNVEFAIDKRPNILTENRLKVANAGDVIRERAMVDVPKEANDYFALVVKLNEANLALREFEQKNGLDPIGLGGAKEYADNPEKFACMWVDGFLKKKKVTLI